jgi:hypothetical protein
MIPQPSPLQQWPINAASARVTGAECVARGSSSRPHGRLRVLVEVALSFQNVGRRARQAPNQTRRGVIELDVAADGPLRHPVNNGAAEALPLWGRYRWPVALLSPISHAALQSESTEAPCILAVTTIHRARRSRRMAPRSLSLAGCPRATRQPLDPYTALVRQRVKPTREVISRPGSGLCPSRT